MVVGCIREVVHLGWAVGVEVVQPGPIKIKMKVSQITGLDAGALYALDSWNLPLLDRFDVIVEVDGRVVITMNEHHSRVLALVTLYRFTHQITINQGCQHYFKSHSHKP